MMKCISMILIIALSMSVAFTSSAVALPDSDERIRELEERVHKLELIIEKIGIPIEEIDRPVQEQVSAVSEAEIYHTPGEKRAAGMGTRLGRAITFGGLIEIEAGAGRTRQSSGGKTMSSDIVLATAQFGWEADFNSHFSSNLVLLWEEESTEPIGIDEGVITWQGKGVDVTAGRLYPPFGTFNSHFITDPLTLDLGETQESGIMVHAALSDLFDVSLSLANGDVDKKQQGNNINDFGLRLDFHPAMKDDSSLDVGLQYYSDIADTNAEILGTSGNILTRTVGGLGAYACLSKGEWTLDAEYIGTVKGFDAADLDVDADGSGDRPATWNFELAYAIDDSRELAFRYEGGSEIDGFPTSRFGIASHWDVGDGISLSAEYLHGGFDRNFSSGGDRKSDVFTTQLGVEF